MSMYDTTGDKFERFLGNFGGICLIGSLIGAIIYGAYKCNQTFNPPDVQTPAAEVTSNAQFLQQELYQRSEFEQPVLDDGQRCTEEQSIDYTLQTFR
ncbi:hypothetical protein ACFLZX_06130 [Nanoarchaeota archaeon]